MFLAGDEVLLAEAFARGGRQGGLDGDDVRGLRAGARDDDLAGQHTEAFDLFIAVRNHGAAAIAEFDVVTTADRDGRVDLLEVLVGDEGVVANKAGGVAGSGVELGEGIAAGSFGLFGDAEGCDEFIERLGVELQLSGRGTGGDFELGQSSLDCFGVLDDFGVEGFGFFFSHG